MTENYYARFRRVAISTPVADEHHAEFGPNLLTALTYYGFGGTPRRVAKVYAGLDDDSLAAACHELERFAIHDKPTNPMERFAFWSITGHELVHQANVIRTTIGTYLSIRTPGTAIGREFLRVMTLDGDSTKPLALLTLNYSQQRVDKLHGYMMSVVAPWDAIAEEDVEWFGANREQIIPIWNHLIQTGTFSRNRVQALIGGSSHGEAPGLLEGSL